MTDADDQYSNLNVPHLRRYLLDRDIVVSNALKKDLVACCRAACILNLQPPKQYATDYRNRGPEEIQTNFRWGYNLSSRS